MGTLPPRVREGELLGSLVCIFTLLWRHKCPFLTWWILHHVGCILAQRVLGQNCLYKSLESSMKPSAHGFAKCVQNRCKCIQNAKVKVK